jgi:hypothetical protein
MKELQDAMETIKDANDREDKKYGQYLVLLLGNCEF